MTSQCICLRVEMESDGSGDNSIASIRVSSCRVLSWFMQTDLNCQDDHGPTTKSWRSTQRRSGSNEWLSCACSGYHRRPRRPYRQMTTTTSICLGLWNWSWRWQNHWGRISWKRKMRRFFLSYSAFSVLSDFAFWHKNEKRQNHWERRTRRNWRTRSSTSRSLSNIMMPVQVNKKTSGSMNPCNLNNIVFRSWCRRAHLSLSSSPDVIQGPGRGQCGIIHNRWDSR